MRQYWQGLTVAEDQTHHVRGKRPAYKARFEQVLKFHPPGLAPVRDTSGAYHIGPRGQAIYQERYIRTFGFYEGRAAVQADIGWFHILPDGKPLYSQPYAWCGNFQEGRSTVRRPDGLYLYLLLNWTRCLPRYLPLRRRLSGWDCCGATGKWIAYPYQS